MKVWFDHQIFSIQRYGGVSRYFVELMQALRQIRGIDAQVIAPAHVNAYLSTAGSAGLFSFELRYPNKGLRFRPRYTAPIFRLAEWIGSPDVIHETHYMLGGQHLRRRARVVATCHDMLFEKYPEWVPGSEDRARQKKKSFDRADAIVCVSEHTRRDLIELYPQYEPKAFTVHHGVSHTPAPTILPMQLPHPYLLYVGVREGYKNFHNLLRAIGHSRILRDGFQLLCFGGGPLTAREKKLAQDSGFNPKRMHHVSGEDQRLTYAYKNAAAFVFPSLYEGFGMPLTEAMVQGCPIACSDASCFPEICGDAAAYFNAHDPADMAQVIEQTVSTADRRTDALRLRSSQFTWQHCASNTAAVYKAIL